MNRQANIASVIDDMDDTTIDDSFSHGIACPVLKQQETWTDV